ncbi:TetR/AcrR family transcriptional regulator [Leptospira stimsonii]|uniref:TetR/AcrR family transcriptional regulator n=1 Tax=Leptospira stimsonii TaxID=2202203 RepID=UPI0014386C47|nr:TetR/AcrR family transcriptional regulator [Leptospira stimsonii]
MLHSAMKQFCKLGYEKTTIGDITKYAGLSTGTFYIYYQSKIEIFKTLLNIGIDGLRRELMDAVKKSIKQKRGNALRELSLAYCNYYKKNPEYYQIIVMVTLQDNDLRERGSRISKLIDKKTLRVLRLVKNNIQDGIKTREFRKVDAWTTAYTFWATLDGVLTLQTRNNLKVVGIELNELISKSIDTLLLGIQNVQKTSRA